LVSVCTPRALAIVSTCSPRALAIVAACAFLLFLTAIGCGRTDPDPEAPFDPWLFLDGDLSRLGEHPGGRQYLFSSHDRSGGNDDGFSGFYSAIRRDERGEYVLAEMEGPGCVRRIWMTWPGRDTSIRVYLDGSSVPEIDCPLDEFFSGLRAPFLPPWVGSPNRFGGICFSYVPIPFRESIRITTADGIRFYQINVERLPDSTDVKSFESVVSVEDSKRLVAAKEAIGSLPVSAAMEVPWTVVEGAGMESHRAAVELVQGKEITFFESDQPGTLRELRLRVSQPADRLRGAVLSAYWDGEAEPSVRVPLADLFGSAFKPPKTWSSAILSADGCGIVRFPMPFEKARLTIQSRGGPDSIETALLVDRTDDPPAARFHALWREQESRAGEPVIFLSTRGRGVYVGTLLSAIAARTEGFLEGDETFIIDGSPETALRGTGTEDYFNSGWYFAQAGVPQPFHGASFVDRENAPRFSAFRFHLADRVPFSESIEVVFEHGDRNHEAGCIYASVSLWYQEGEGERTGPMPDSLAFLPKRVVNPRHLVPLQAVEGAEPADSENRLEWSDVTAGWMGPPVRDPAMEIHVIGPGRKPLEMKFLVPADGQYDVSLVYARGPGYDPLDVFVDGNALCRNVPGSADGMEPSHRTDPVRMKLTEGRHQMTIRPVGPAHGEGIRGTVQGLLLEPAGPFVIPWLVAGPFDNRSDRGFDQVFRPEREHVQGGYVSTDGMYGGLDRARIGWVRAEADSAGYVDLRGLLGPGAYRVGYGATWCESPDARRVLFSCGGDDGLAVWVNGEEVWRNHVHRGWGEGDDRFTVNLDQGRNEILVKVDQFIAGWGYSLRVSDPDGELIFRDSNNW